MAGATVIKTKLSHVLIGTVAKMLRLRSLATGQV